MFLQLARDKNFFCCCSFGKNKNNQNFQSNSSGVSDGSHFLLFSQLPKHHNQSIHKTWDWCVQMSKIDTWGGTFVLYRLVWLLLILYFLLKACHFTQKPERMNCSVLINAIRVCHLLQTCIWNHFMSPQYYTIFYVGINQKERLWICWWC